MRTVIGMLIAAALAIGVLVFWFDSPSETPPVTEIALPSTSSTVTTTSGEPPTTTSTTAPDPTATSVESHVVETVDEAETILRDLWFGWFEGIYNEDEERIREVVASNGFLQAGQNAFGVLEFSSYPTRDGITFLELEILTSTNECLAVWSLTQPEFLNITEARSGVEVLRNLEGEWRFMSAWQMRDDLWQDDCEAQLQPLS